MLFKKQIEIEWCVSDVDFGTFTKSAPAVLKIDLLENVQSQNVQWYIEKQTPPVDSVSYRESSGFMLQEHFPAWVKGWCWLIRSTFLLY